MPGKNYRVNCRCSECNNCLEVLQQNGVFGLFCNLDKDIPCTVKELYDWQKTHKVNAYGICDDFEEVMDV